jgi:hypothetical protein
MNCRNFEAVINDLGRHQMTDARLRESGLAHAESCRRCAARLEQERDLTAGLHALAASAVSVEAPARVEAMLLAAFRERRAASVATTAAASTHDDRVVHIKTKTRSWPRWYAHAAAAALLLMFALTGALTLERLRSAGSRNVAFISGTVPPLQASVNVDDKQPQNDYVAVNNISGGQSIKLTPEEAAVIRNPARRNQSARGNLYPTSAALRNRRTTGGGMMEIATDFIPVRYGDNLSSVDSGRIVRVEMPRSALVALGLPMNMERAGERVKADVLLGEDGMARAIRFVR